MTDEERELQERQRRWFEFLIEPLPIPRDQIDVGKLIEYEKKQVRFLIETALQNKLLALSSPSLIQFIHVIPDNLKIDFGVTTAARDDSDIKNRIALTTWHGGFVHEKKGNISFFKNALDTLVNKGKISVFSRKPKPENKIDFADFLYAHIDVKPEKPFIKDELLVRDDFNSIENTEYKFLSEEVFYNKVQYAAEKSLAVVGADKISNREIDDDLEAIIGKPLIADYVKHIAPLTHYGQVVLCAPLLYRFDDDAVNKRLGGGGCLFLLDDSCDLSNELLLQELYLLSHKICSLVLVTLDVASVSAKEEVQIVTEKAIQNILQNQQINEEVGELLADAWRRESSERLEEWRSSHLFITESAADEELLEELSFFARTDIPILITGGTGLGKEFTSLAIAKMSLRDENLTRTINCAAFSEDLLMSELFGHVKGSFTGASSHKLGLILEASGYVSDGTAGSDIHRNTKDYHKWLRYKKDSVELEERTAKNGEKCWGYEEGSVGGTLILDEFAELSQQAQAALLRVIDGYPVKPVGHDGKGFLPNIRIICVTNDDIKLSKEVRSDLKARIEGYHVIVDKLENRPETVKKIIHERYSKVKFHVQDSESKEVEFNLSQDVLNYILSNLSNFKGGLRELGWMIQRACVYAFMQNDETTVRMSHLEKAINKGFLWNDKSANSENYEEGSSGTQAKNLRTKIEEILHRANVEYEEGWSYDLFKKYVKKINDAQSASDEKKTTLNEMISRIDDYPTESHAEAFRYSGKDVKAIRKLVVRAVEKLNNN